MERLRALFLKSRVDREVEEEMRFHLEMEAKQREIDGLSPQEARRQARLAFGSVERYRAEVRENRWGHHVDLLMQDLRDATRSLFRDPGKSTVIVLSLALGIGVSAAVASVARSILLGPLPYPAGETAMWIQASWKNKPDGNLSPAEFLDFRDQMKNTFDAVGVYSFGAANVLGDGEPERVQMAFVSAEVFGALGVEPLRGRFFTAEEEVQSTTPVVLTEGYWHRRFAADPEIIGRTIRLNASEAQIVAVLPAGFRLPEQVLGGESVQIFGPQGIEATRVTTRGNHYLSGVARRRADVSAAQAANVVEALASEMVRKHPTGYPTDMEFTATAIPLKEQVRGPVSAPLRLLLGAVIFLLLITCANVVHLLLADTDRRQREFALRAVLGAGQGRLLTQAMVESLVLATLGGLCGVLLAMLLTGPVAARWAETLPWLERLRPDGTLLALATGLSVVCGLICGLVPALSAGQGVLSGWLKEGARTTLGSKRSQRLRHSLVVAEVAVALLLLTGAGLLARSLYHLLDLDPGFRTEQVVSAQIVLPGSAYPDDEQRTGFFRRLIPLLATLPGVENAGAVTNLPLATGLGDMNFTIEGRPILEGDLKPAADWQVVTPGYFQTMGLELLRGRWIGPQDRVNAPGALVINETFAGRHWPGEDALGRRLRLGGERTAPREVEVVGVVADVRHSLIQDQTPQMYLAHEQFRSWSSGRPLSALTLVVQSSRPTAELRKAIADTVRKLDADLPVAQFRTMEEVHAAYIALPRVLALGVLAFAVVALLLAMAGIYGVLNHSVGRRRPELGLRLALGARPAELRSLVFFQGARLAAVGALCGSLAMALLSPSLRGLLFGVEPGDPKTLALVAGILFLVVFVACWVPALRAGNTDPARLLRAES